MEISIFDIVVWSNPINFAMVHVSALDGFFHVQSLAIIAKQSDVKSAQKLTVRCHLNVTLQS